ncbi:MAG: hypothetical protein AAFU54_28500 [Chloroflexota bacterium]
MNFKNNVSPVLRFVDRFWIGMYLGTVIIVTCCVHPLFFTPITRLFGPEMLNRAEFVYYSSVVFGVMLIVYRFFIAHRYRPAHLMQLWLMVPLMCASLVVWTFPAEQYVVASLRYDSKLTYHITFSPEAIFSDLGIYDLPANKFLPGYDVYRCNHISLRCHTYWRGYGSAPFPASPGNLESISCTQEDCTITMDGKTYHAAFVLPTNRKYFTYCIYEDNEPVLYRSLWKDILDPYGRMEDPISTDRSFHVCTEDAKPAPHASDNPTP